MIKILVLAIGALMMSACSVFGDSGVEIASYNVVSKQDMIEVRTYNELVLVTAPMRGDMDGQRGAFGKLFDYISGNNTGEAQIAMTAPVIRDQPIAENTQGTEIAMTAPVFMDERQNGQWEMSFVLPAEMSYETAPRPLDPDVKLEKVENLLVAVITFNGRLSDENVQKHREILKHWIAQSDYKAVGAYKTAGYNPPWTLPMARRNEVLIPVVKK